MFGTGPLTVIGGVEVMAWVPTKYTNRFVSYPIYPSLIYPNLNLKVRLFGTRPFTVMGGVEGMAWAPTKYTNRFVSYN